MRRDTRVSRKFDAFDDQGNRYAIVEYQELIESQALGRPPEWIKGMKRLELDDGSPVNFKDENTFEIVMSGVTVRVPK